MPKKPKKTVQEIIEEMKDLHDQEDDLMRELEAGYGSLTTQDFEDLYEQED
jgi:hypothetical protein|tara:strand:+ start:221 stop:373 length:153 start_codon:yes stop_codon:yes gene_type:complete